jgi:hypothetical protein
LRGRGGVDIRPLYVVRLFLVNTKVTDVLDVIKVKRHVWRKQSLLMSREIIDFGRVASVSKRRYEDT